MLDEGVWGLKTGYKEVGCQYGEITKELQVSGVRHQGLFPQCGPCGPQTGLEIRSGLTRSSG